MMQGFDISTEPAEFPMVKPKPLFLIPEPYFPHNSPKVMEIMGSSRRVRIIQSCEKILRGLCITREVNQDAIQQVLWADLIGTMQKGLGVTSESESCLQVLFSVIPQPQSVYRSSDVIDQLDSGGLYIVATFDVLSIAGCQSAEWNMSKECIVRLEQVVGNSNGNQHSIAV